MSSLLSLIQKVLSGADERKKGEKVHLGVIECFLTEGDSYYFN